SSSSLMPMDAAISVMGFSFASWAICRSDFIGGYLLDFIFFIFEFENNKRQNTNNKGLFLLCLFT
ncbi:MAG TPA: hypothetical protein VFD10_07750, partial [Atribacterota bacterium]|nr:hypothetical protein [Atribacterota bacterium]